MSPVSFSAREGTVICELCPRLCRLAPGEAGDCRARVNLDGELLAVTHSHPVALHVDPMEKKPLYHFLPGTPIFSIATAGCNLHCRNCQNWEISQAEPWETESYELGPLRIVELAQREQCRSIAYTYTEPLVFYEYTRDTSIAAHEAGLRNVLVTAGYINPGPLRELLPHVDAANIDLKAMSDAFYRDICGASLQPVLNTLRIAREMGVWVEVTNLVIPTLNDDDAMIRSLARWMVEHLGTEVPLHFSGFTPRHKLENLPRTPAETLVAAREIALAEGLQHVYVGNVLGTAGSDTLCPHDGTVLIERVGYRITGGQLSAEGTCPSCGHACAGVWQ